jgi:signal transduction histidine kinase
MPSFVDFVMGKLIFIATVMGAVDIFLVVSFELNSYEIIALIVISMGVLLYAIYKEAVRIQNELRVINRYLKNLDDYHKLDKETLFFTKEFENIKQNLIKVLKKAKKREDIKKKYNAKLKLKNKQRADMLSAIAHEFRNPIASIMGYSQTLTDDKDIPQNLRDKFLAKIYNNGAKIESLLSRLVLWNKFESGEAKLHKTKFDTKILLVEIIQSLKEKYKHRDIIIQGDTLEIEADRTLMDVALKNLIENALKYSKDEVIVILESGKICIQDFGVGIKEEDIAKVTKKFYRSGEHNWDNSMGLGLSIVKTIVELHGFKLSIKSKKNEGSTFCIEMGK